MKTAVAIVFIFISIWFFALLKNEQRINKELQYENDSLKVVTGKYHKAETINRLQREAYINDSINSHQNMRIIVSKLKQINSKFSL